MISKGMISIRLIVKKHITLQFGRYSIFCFFRTMLDWYEPRRLESYARKEQPSIPEKVTPHILRHSKAMHLLEAGVNIVYIRDILGHVDIATTGIYARSNLEMKRKALEKVAIVPDANDVPFWTEDKDLLSWLKGYGKSL